MVKNITDVCLWDLSSISLSARGDDINSSPKKRKDTNLHELEYREDVAALIERRFPELCLYKGDSYKEQPITIGDTISKKEHIGKIFSYSLDSKLINDKSSIIRKESTAICLDDRPSIAIDINQKYSYEKSGLLSLNTESERIKNHVNHDSQPKKHTEVTVKIPLVETGINIGSSIFRTESEVKYKKNNIKQSTFVQRMRSVYTKEISADKLDTRDVKLNYLFQSWSGDHSVKVSLPINGGIILQPSDTRTSDTLARQLNELVDLQPELLLPQKDREQRKDQHHQNFEQQDDES